MLASDIIIKPIVTEHSMEGMQDRKYTFKVHVDANKIEIAKAVEEMFPGTEVVKVWTVNYAGKEKRRGRTVGRLPSWKKAIVKLTPDCKDIEFFEGLA